MAPRSASGSCNKTCNQAVRGIRSKRKTCKKPQANKQLTEHQVCESLEWPANPG